jgi:acyl-CoA synthetase (AMP-forming)/AMP-acid ligase II
MAVRVSLENLLQNSAVVRCLFGHTPESVGVSWLPMFHDMGLMASLQALYCGVPMVQMPPLAFLQKPVRWLRAISRYQATTSGGPDFAYDLCARKVTAEQRAGLDLSRWDVAFSGAEMVRAETLDRFADAFAECGFRREAFYPCYGMAEATTLATGGSRSAPPVVLPVRRQALWQGRVEDSPGSEEAWRLVGCGTPPPGHRVLIVDPELRRVCPPDRIGEVWLSGPSIAAGYWNRPEETEATFHAFLAGSGEGPFLRTGDLGFVRGGELFLSGRLKELVIIRGQNHSPQDLEQTVAKAHPALQTGSGAAFSVDVEGAERLVIVYELDRGAMRGGELAELTASIREALAAEHGLETHEVVLVGPRSVPRTSSGKIQRRLCRELYANGSLEALPV